MYRGSISIIGYIWIQIRWKWRTPNKEYTLPWSNISSSSNDKRSVNIHGNTNIKPIFVGTTARIKNCKKIQLKFSCLFSLQNVWPWQDLNLHTTRRDSNPQCSDRRSDAFSNYATRCSSNWATWPLGFCHWKSRLGLECFNKCGNKELRNDALSVAMFCWTEIYDLWDVLDDILCVWHILSLWCVFLQLSKGMSLAGLLLEFP